MESLTAFTASEMAFSSFVLMAFSNAVRVLSSFTLPFESSRTLVASAMILSSFEPFTASALPLTSLTVLEYAVAARICPAIRMGSAELRDAHTTRIPAADGILREELLRHRPFRLGRPWLPHPLVGLILWMIWKNDGPIKDEGGHGRAMEK